MSELLKYNLFRFKYKIYGKDPRQRQGPEEVF